MVERNIFYRLLIFIIVLFIIPLTIGQPNGHLQADDYKDAQKVNDALKNNPGSVDYSQISYKDPKLDYSLLDYTQVNYDDSRFDHSRVDSKKYLSDIGCQNCRFNRGNVGVKYSPEGLIHPKSGLFKVQMFPEDTRFIENSETIVASIPENSAISLENPEDLGSGTIDATKGSLYYRVSEQKEVRLTGEVSISKDGKLHIKKGDACSIPGYDVIAQHQDVYLNFDGKRCQDNCISFGDSSIYVRGKGFKFKPTFESKIFKVNDDLFDSGAVYSENDVLEITLGNLEDKEGEVIVSKAQNSMPLIETKGFVRLKNDKVPLRLSGDRFEIELRTDLDETLGSVPLSLAVGGNKDRYLQFDDSQNLYVDNKETYLAQVNLRKSMEDNFGVKVKGYFSENELKLFKEKLTQMEELYGMNIKNVVGHDGSPLSIKDSDRRHEGESAGAKYFEDEHAIIWIIGDRQIKPETKVMFNSGVGGGSKFPGFSSDAFVHEFHHSLYALDPGFQERLNQKLEEIGFRIKKDSSGDYNIDKDSITSNLLKFFQEGLDPSDDMLVDEVQAYISQEHVNNPSWFNDPTVSPEIRNKRQKFREAYGFDKFKWINSY